MSMKKVGSIEVYELDENLDKYTRKEREEYINELFKQEYQGKEISYLLNGEEIKALINSTTRKNFRAYQHSDKFEYRNAYNARQDIAFSDDYISLISNASHYATRDEKKIGQNKNHKVKNKWHYFIKYIVCNGYYFMVVIEILENNSKFIIYSTKLKEVDSPTISRGYTPTSSATNIS